MKTSSSINVRLSGINFNFFLALLFVSMLSCTESRDDLEQTPEITENMILDVLSELKSIGDKTELPVIFEFQDIHTSNRAAYIKPLNMNKHELAFYMGTNKSFNSTRDGYTVTCTYNNGETEVTECPDTACAGSATWKCLRNGGCSTICNPQLMYIPASYKERALKVENLSNRLKEVISESQNKGGSSFDITIGVENSKFTINKLRQISKPQNNTKNWEVNCYDSDGELIWSDTFDDRWDASNAIIDCVDNYDGCAEVCEISGIKYFHQSKN